MSDAVTILIGLLDEELAVCNELKQLMLAEQQALITLDTVKMEELNSRKEKMVLRQRKTAESLKEAMGRTAHQAGLAATCSLSDLVRKLPPEAGKRAKVLQNELLKTGTEVSDLARQNKEMLERFLATVNTSLSFITKVLNSSNFYGAGGTYLNNERTGAMIVNREA